MFAALVDIGDGLSDLVEVFPNLGRCGTVAEFVRPG
jgi:hypothetical protein